MKKTSAYLFCVLLVVACSSTRNVQEKAQKFLDAYNTRFQDLSYAADLADWKSNTIIIEGDTANAYATRMAEEELAAFTGSTENIETARTLLKNRDDLKPIQVLQLEKVLYHAVDNPQTVPDLVRARIKAETELVERLYGFDFQINGQSVSANDLDDMLINETDLDRRLKAWESSKEVGARLKDGLDELRRLRNETVRALGYDDYFSYQVSDYGMTTEEMLDLVRSLNREVRPLYRELHTYFRYELARRYGVNTVPDLIPAHWLPNRWGQDWNPLVTVKGLDLDGVLKSKSPEWVVQSGERFYVSLGFPKLPASFWETSSLYPLPPDAGYKKNNHASAWHMDLDQDVRCLMSVVPNAGWYETVNHELGHIYYYLTYSNPDVPVLLREGANRAFHEGIGSLMGLAAMQKPFLDAQGLLPANADVDEMQALLKESLNFIVFIPWSAGVMTEFEHDLYAGDLPEDRFNTRWWQLTEEQQGIAPPYPRGEEYCDPASKTHIIDDPAQYYDYALSYFLLFQLHDYISREILHQDPHATNYFGNQEVGAFLRDIMKSGSSKDWREVLKDATGEELSAQAMLRYFEPLMAYLKEKNQGRTYTLGDI
jgi:peptidyl-dipeptidase A